MGDRSKNISRAVELLEGNKKIRIREKSSIYETEPVGGPPQGYFLNQVIEIETNLAPQDLLRSLLEIERKLGRKRGVDSVRDKTPKMSALPSAGISNGVRWGPRLIDLDILLFDDLILKEFDLEIPHPRLARRKFILVLLAEINSELYHPVLKRKIRDILIDLKDDNEVQVYK